MITFFFFFNDTATTEIYTLSLHDALPILCWIFCCGTCVGRDTLKVFGFERFLPSSDHNRRRMRNYKYSPASTEEEEWEMLEEGANANDVEELVNKSG